MLTYLQQVMGLLRMRPRDYAAVGHGDAWEQAASAVLVHGHAPPDVRGEDLLRLGDVAPARPQEIPADMGDDAQAQERDGPA